MDYIPNTDRDRQEMLDAIGVASIEELFADIPEEVRLAHLMHPDGPTGRARSTGTGPDGGNVDLPATIGGSMSLPAPMSEYELVRHMEELARKNGTLDEYVCFRGAGAYDHFIPSAVSHITGRSEFYTAYTPYQAEVSQGTLTSIFEYQSLICELTGMDISNASLYDGASAVAEAAVLAHKFTKRDEVLVSEAVHPEHRLTLRTYARNLGMVVREIPVLAGLSTGMTEAGRTDIDALRDAITDRTACVIMQNPNFFGVIERMREASALVRERGALFVASVDPISLGLLAPPGEYGADIAVGEGQALGNPLWFGGPYLGFFTCRADLVRYMPGRLVGETRDAAGRRGFVLTLQAREQHVRRERATSNICSNEALCALAAAVYLSLLGKTGIREVARLCLQKSHYLAGALSERLKGVEGFRLPFGAPFFKEFVAEFPGGDPAHGWDAINRRLLAGKIIGPLPLARFYGSENSEGAGGGNSGRGNGAGRAGKNGMIRGFRPGNAALFCVTEKRTRAEMDRLVDAIANIILSGD
ncbi:MAG TPA: aminomethyl-transferring glycine dehydrogenase subunit GcvPA [Firmicutes bacterium]|nr:aminomethyl-transferring glycine dehydrogenase subunit GcvPA [Bacillota bacterium]